MRINRVIFKNFGSYGNKTHILEMPEIPSFFLVQGKNGYGKCLLPSSELKIFAKDDDFEKFQEFLRTYRSK